MELHSTTPGYDCSLEVRFLISLKVSKGHNMTVRELASMIIKFALSLHEEGTGFHAIIHGVGEQHPDLCTRETSEWTTVA